LLALGFVEAARLLGGHPLAKFRAKLNHHLKFHFPDVILKYNSEGNSMLTTNLRKVGGSIMLAVPPALLELLNLQAGAEVGIAVESGRLIVEPRARRRYTLHELLAQCDPNAPRATEEQEWLDNKPVGGELI
jgi:antitoxin ChpS